MTDFWVETDVIRNMKKQNVRTLSLIVATITYLLIGAAIFDRFINTKTNTNQTQIHVQIQILSLIYSSVLQYLTGLEIQIQIQLLTPIDSSMQQYLTGCQIQIQIQIQLLTPEFSPERSYLTFLLIS